MFRKGQSLLAFRRIGSLSTAACACVPLQSAASGFASSSPSVLASSSSSSHCSCAFRFYGPGENRRLTYDERADKRMHKNRANREERQALILEAEQIANIEFMEELEAEFSTVFAKAQTSALKVTNMQRCLEAIEIEVGGRKVPLLQAAQIIKVSPLELHVVPTQAAFASPILQRLMRFDSTITAQKEQHKIKLTLQRMTTARRDKAAAEIKQIQLDFVGKLKNIRNRFTRLLAGVGAGDDIVQQLTATIDKNLKEFIELKDLEFEELVATVTSLGVDESDASL